MNQEGIISEPVKFVDEMALLNKNREKLVIDLTHEINKIREEELMEFESDVNYSIYIKLYKCRGNL